MIKVKIQFSNHFKSEYSSNIIELKYINPVILSKVFKDAKIAPANVWLIKINGSVVSDDYLVDKSCEIKLLPIIGGG